MTHITETVGSHWAVEVLLLSALAFPNNTKYLFASLGPAHIPACLGAETHAGSSLTFCSFPRVGEPVTDSASLKLSKFGSLKLHTTVFNPLSAFFHAESRVGFAKPLA